MQYFDIYLRNGVGAMYTPSLNVSSFASFASPSDAY